MLAALEIICIIILIEAITNILIKSDIFRLLRAYLFESNNKVLRFIHIIKLFLLHVSVGEPVQRNFAVFISK